MKGVPYGKFLEFSPIEAREYLRSYIDFQVENEKRSNPGLEEDELPRRYLDEILKDSHCTTRHSSDNLEYLIDRLVVRPPNSKHPRPQYSTFETDTRARFAVSDTIYCFAKTVASRITDFAIKSKDDIILEKNFGAICGSGVIYDKGLIRFAFSSHIIAVLGVDKYNPLNDLHCKVKTAYPDLSYGKSVVDKTRKATELFYEKLLNHPSKTLRQAWALTLSGYNITPVKDYNLANKHGEDSWDSKKLSVDFLGNYQNTGQKVILSALFHELENGNIKVSYSKCVPNTNQRGRIDEDAVPIFVMENIPEIKNILKDPDIVIKNCREKAIERLDKIKINDEPIE